MADIDLLNPALRDFWMTEARIRVLYGGRASSKSHDAAGVAVAMSNMMPLNIVCARQFQNSIKDSVKGLIEAKIEAFGLQKRFKIANTYIENRFTGSSFIFKGIARSLQEIKSLEGIDILWIEECQALTETQFEVLEPTIRKDGSQIWLIFNPQLLNDYVYKNFVTNPPPDAITRMINFDENPFLSETMRKVIEKHRERSPDTFRHVYLGEPISDDDRVIIKLSWIMSAIDFHKKIEGYEPGGRAYVGFDVADSGSDKCATVARVGMVALEAEQWQAGEDELGQSTSKAVATADKYPGSELRYDSIGVGAGVGSKCAELNELRAAEGRRPIEYQKYNAGAGVFRPDDEYEDGVKNGDFFLNLKSQAWWCVADRFRNTHIALTQGVEFAEDQLISISSDIECLDQLVSELATPRRTFNMNGKVQVETKEQLEKRGVKSPNLADAFVSAFAPMDKSAGFFDD